MQIKNLFFAALILIGFTACNNDEIAVDNTQTAKYDTYLSINVTSPSIKKDFTPSTKTVGTEAPDTDGTEVTSIHVYLVKNGVIEYATAPSITGLETGPFQVPTGDYKLFVVVNPTSPTPRNSGNINIVIDEVTKDQAQTGYKSGSFLMATACDVVDFSTVGEDVSIIATNDFNHPAIATVSVDRVAVKVYNKTEGDVTSKLAGNILEIKKDGTSTPFFGEVEVQGFVLVNGNTKFNLIQKWETLTVDVVGKVANTPQGSLGTTYMEGYYSPIQEFGEVDMTKDVTTGEWTTKSIIDKTLGHPEIYSENPVFTTENRPNFLTKEKLTSNMAQTTGVIYRTVANNGKTFYYVGGIAYSSLLELMKLDAFKDKGWDDSTPASDIRLAGVKVYEEGNMYYTYFIKDQNYKVNYLSDNINYYAVLRNSVYNLTINSIKNIGDDIPGGGIITPENPNPEIDPDDTYLNVTVSINPWVLNNITIDL